jgi:RNA polymerase sigma factor (sigma-70 family)
MKQSGTRFDVIGQLGALRRYARSLTRGGADAEDLVHDTLMRAYESRGTFRADGNIRAWLLTILHNVFIDRTRTRKTEAVRNEQALYLADESMQAPQEHAVRLAEVREAFLALPEDQRAALHLVAIEGLSYQQAADALAIPVGTLMSRIGRARSTLRDMENAPPKPNHLRIVGGSQ